MIDTIMIHHSAVSREKNSNQFKAIKKYHIDKGWGDIGYNYVIEPNGAVKQGRTEGAELAHCKESNMNFRAIAIMLTGNFDIERPTIEQLTSLKKLINGIRKKHGDLQVRLHREFATYKSCPGELFFFNHKALLSTNLNIMNKYETILNKEVPTEDRIFSEIKGDSPLTEKEVKSLIEIANKRASGNGGSNPLVGLIGKILEKGLTTNSVILIGVIIAGMVAFTLIEKLL